MLLLIALLSLLPIRSKGDPLSNRTLPVKDTNCAAPWMDGSAVGLGCLLFESDIALTWYNASAFCQDQKSAKLIAIESAEQKEFVIMVIGFLSGHEATYNWWTSGVDQGREAEWYWASTLTSVGSYIWAQDQPNAGTDDNCLYIKDGEGWDGDCTLYKCPICEL